MPTTEEDRAAGCALAAVLIVFALGGLSALVWYLGHQDAGLAP